MTYGRVRFTQDRRVLDGAAVSHSAELVRGDFFARIEGPLIRPSRATFSPRGEGSSRLPLENSPRFGQPDPGVSLALYAQGVTACTVPEGFARLATPEAEIAYRWEPGVLKVGQFFAAEVIACRAPGPGAVREIVLDAQMPAHGHGMNYRPTATPTGPGRFPHHGTDAAHGRHMAADIRPRPGRHAHAPDAGGDAGAMRALAAIAALAALAIAGGAALMAKSEPPVAFSDAERAAILAHGPWPQPLHARPEQPCLRQPRRHCARQAAVRGHAPVRRRQALVRDLPRPGPLLRRRPRPQRRARPRRPQRHRARQPAAQPLVRLGRGRRQPVGAEHPPDPRREGARGNARARARAAGGRCRDRGDLRAPVWLSACGGCARCRAGQRGQGAGGLPGDHNDGTHAVRRLPRCARSEATGRPWPAIPPRRSAA